MPHQSQPGNLRLTVHNGFLHVVDIKEEQQKLSRSSSAPILSISGLKASFDKNEASEGDVACAPWSEVKADVSSEVSSEGDGELCCRTVMVKNLPCACRQEEIIDAIDSLGFGGQWDFFYMPTRKPKRSKNLGYAFISFPDANLTKQFGEAMTGFQFAMCRDKSIAVVPARLQDSYKQLFKSSRAKKRVVLGSRSEDVKPRLCSQ